MRDVYILLGAPGSGKGTQAKPIASKLGIPHISLGDVLRAAVKNQTKVGIIAKNFIEAGKLVPDEVVLQVAEEAIKGPEYQKGFVVDGFPRTLVQANLFDELVKKLGFSINKVIYIDLPLTEILKRLSGRRSCRKCGAVYHTIFNAPKKEGVCDLCGGELYQRQDDTEATIKVRFEVYEKETSPLVGYYKKAGKLVTIDGTKTVNEVTQALLKLV
jgi:adenylate kinase